HPGSTTLSGGRMTTRARGAVVPDRVGGQRGVTKVNALWDNNVCRMARHRTLHPGAKEPFNKGMMWSRCGNVVLCGHPRQCQRAERQDAQDGKLGQVMVRCRTWRKTAAFL